MSVGQVLTGGNVSEVVRIGDTVHRSQSPGAAATHALLRVLEERGFDGAPRFLGIDDDGREVLTYIRGLVPASAAAGPRVMEDGALASVACLARRIHDLTVNAEFSGNDEVCCHHDLAPNNTVYREVDGALEAIAFIDWDLCGPGRRIQDLAHICWQYLDLGPAVSDIPETLRKIGVICDAYGLDNRGDVIAEVIAWQERCAAGIDAGAQAGDVAMQRLRDAGHADDIRGAALWCRRNLSTRWPISGESASCTR